MQSQDQTPSPAIQNATTDPFSSAAATPRGNGSHPHPHPHPHSHMPLPPPPPSSLDLGSPLQSAQSHSGQTPLIVMTPANSSNRAFPPHRMGSSEAATSPSPPSYSQAVVLSQHVAALPPNLELESGSANYATVNQRGTSPPPHSDVGVAGEGGGGASPFYAFPTTTKVELPGADDANQTVSVV